MNYDKSASITKRMITHSIDELTAWMPERSCAGNEI